MGDAALNNEFKKYWSLLSPAQKELVIQLVRTFNRPGNDSLVRDEVAVYKTKAGSKEEIFEELSDKEKFSVMILVKTFLEGDGQQPGDIAIADYNKEIEEAMKRMDGGEYINHDDLENEAREW